MRILTHTPPRAWLFAVVAVLVYASAPLLAIAYYSEMLRKGAYPPYGDSIAIPISEVLTLAAIFAPVYILFLVLTLLGYPGAVSLWVWNGARSVWSWLWTVLCGVAVVLTATNLIDAWRWRLPLEFLNVALWIWLLLAFRAVLVARAPRRAEPEPSRHVPAV